MAAQTFGNLLRAELDRQSIGVRTLARKMTEAQPDRLETVRRGLIKYLADEHVPTEPTRHAIEDVLAVPRDALKPTTPRGLKPLRAADLADGFQMVADLLRAVEEGRVVVQDAAVEA